MLPFIRQFLLSEAAFLRRNVRLKNTLSCTFCRSLRIRKMRKWEAEVTSNKLTSNISQSVLLHQWSVECGPVSDVWCQAEDRRAGENFNLLESDWNNIGRDTHHQSAAQRVQPGPAAARNAKTCLFWVCIKINYLRGAAASTEIIYNER